MFWERIKWSCLGCPFCFSVILPITGFGQWSSFTAIEIPRPYGQRMLPHFTRAVFKSCSALQHEMNPNPCSETSSVLAVTEKMMSAGTKPAEVELAPWRLASQLRCYGALYIYLRLGKKESSKLCRDMEKKHKGAAAESVSDRRILAQPGIRILSFEGAGQPYLRNKIEIYARVPTCKKHLPQPKDNQDFKGRI